MERARLRAAGLTALFLALTAVSLPEQQLQITIDSAPAVEPPEVDTLAVDVLDQAGVAVAYSAGQQGALQVGRVQRDVTAVPIEKGGRVLVPRCDPHIVLA